MLNSVGGCCHCPCLCCWVYRWKFSKVSSILISYGRLCSKLTRENYYLLPLPRCWECVVIRCLVFGVREHRKGLWQPLKFWCLLSAVYVWVTRLGLFEVGKFDFLCVWRRADAQARVVGAVHGTHWKLQVFIYLPPCLPPTQCPNIMLGIPRSCHTPLSNVCAPCESLRRAEVCDAHTLQARTKLARADCSAHLLNTPTQSRTLQHTATLPGQTYSGVPLSLYIQPYAHVFHVYE